VQRKTTLKIFLLLALLVGNFHPAAAARPESQMAQSGEVTAFDLIIAMNTLRTSYGLAALIEDPIINAVAQSTAEIMAANQMSWHIGDVSGRLASAGYGAGYKVWGTENFAVGNMSIDEIMVVWADPSHMIPAVNPAYCNVGAGVAKSSNGLTYYVLQAAYTSGKACGEYKSPLDETTPREGTTNEGRVSGVSQLIVPVKIATPDASGKIYHVVEAGQSFWSIAVAYQITIKDIETWNNIKKENGLQIGQKLFIPGKDTEGFATPTPVGMIVPSTPGPDGRVIHSVASYQTLITIAQAYNTEVDTILALNGLQIDWPLQIGQQLVVRGPLVTPTHTPVPLTPLQKLTPASDGKYYHTVQSGETLSWIAELYEVPVFDLMTWNGLNNSSILQPNQKLLLQVTPPATATPTPAPATATFTPEPPTHTPTATATQQLTLALTASATPASQSSAPTGWVVGLGLSAGMLGLLAFFIRRRK
jgi:LysM repeat protein